MADWACECAEHVLPLFEKAEPDDARPRKAVEAGRAWARGELSPGDTRTAAFAAHTAAHECGDDAARSVARAAGHAAATAHLPAHARHAADYAVRAVRAAAEAEGADAEAARSAERQRQASCLPEELRDEVSLAD